MMPLHSKYCAIIVAAGTGSRAGGGVEPHKSLPKQFWSLGEQGLTVLDQALAPFILHDMIAHIVIVTHENNFEKVQALTNARHSQISVVSGGVTRQLSVLAGLKSLEDKKPDYVLVHDAARPLLTPDRLNALIEASAPDIGLTLALPITDTLTRISDGEIEPVSRKNIFAIQTPQLFPFAKFIAAHQQFAQDDRTDFTDDAGLMAAIGMPIQTVNGSADNLKITFPDDIKRAEQILLMKDNPQTSTIPDIRVGHGYDLHTLVAGDGVILCGVKIPHHKKLSGHSDADVALHALTDALLASIADGDIGSHFPPSDPQWKGAKSDQFLIHAHNLVKQKHGHLTHCDITIVCEEPKIGPYRVALRENLASILEIDVSRVSVKATTNEQIGSIGRKEGICALATATVIFVA